MKEIKVSLNFFSPSFLFVILFLFFLPFIVFAVGENWLSGYIYRIPITIDNPNSTALTNYQVLIVTNTANLISQGKMKSNGADIRFTDEDGETLLSYWIEEGTINTGSTRIWVKVPNIPVNSTKIIYMYYGKADATSESNGDNTFEFFDDFEDGQIDTNKWTTSGIFSSTETAGQLRLSLNGGYAITNTNFSGEYMMECSIMIPEGYPNSRQRVNSLKSDNDDTCSFDKGLFYPQVYFGDYTQVTWYTNTTYRHQQQISTSTNTWVWINPDYSVLYSSSYTPSGQPAKFKFVAGDQGGSLSGSLYLNWVFVRKYTSSEPSIIAENEESAKRIVFISAPKTVSAGTVSSQITIQIKDSYGNPINVSQDTTINLITTSLCGKFYSDSNGTVEITSVTIPSGQSSASFYYKDTKAMTPININRNSIGKPVIIASATVQGWIINGYQAETIISSSAYNIEFVQQPSTTTAGQIITPAVSVQVLDGYCNVFTSTADVSISIYNNLGGGVLCGTLTKKFKVDIGSFTLVGGYQAGNCPWSVFSADLDNDGDNDLVVANRNGNNISFLRNNGDGSFSSAGNYSVGSDPVSIFSIDVDNDGYNDLVTANRESNNISVLKNKGDGTFYDTVNYSVANSPFSVFSSDIDNDGDNDLVVANYESSNVSVLKNYGNGTFANAVNYGTGSSPMSVFVADLDNDGDNDLAVVNYGSNNVSILKNNGDGTFSSAVNYNVGSNPWSVFVADLDNDGDNDLAVANYGSNNVSILRNNGDGIFLNLYNYNVGNHPMSVFSADLNKDGWNDLVVTNYGSNNVSVLKNAATGIGAFESAVNYPAGNNPVGVFIADLDNDGDNDLVVGSGADNSYNISVLQNNGDGSFSSPISCPTGNEPWSVFCADLDNDGDNDIIAGNQPDWSISVLKNNGGFAIFDDLWINKSGQGYKLKAESTGFGYKISDQFNINPSTVSKIVFITSPQTITAGNISSVMSIQTQDSFDNVSNVNSNTTINLNTTSSGGKFYLDNVGSLEITSVTIPSGQNTVSFYYKDTKAGVPTITCSETPSQGWTDAVQQQTINPADANKLAFIVQPSTTTAGQVITPAVQVAVQDQYGNTITSDNSTQITISTNANPWGSSLLGTKTKIVSNGVAIFNDLSIQKTGIGYQLKAEAVSLNPDISDLFDIVPAEISKIVFITSPQTITAGKISSVMSIQTQDSFGNISNVTSTTTINLITNSLNGKFYSDSSGTQEITSIEISSGTNSASFYYRDTKSGVPTIICSETPDKGWADAEQQQTINPADAVKLSFIVQPTNTPSNQTIKPAVEVAVQDQYDNTITSDNSTQINISISVNPSGGLLSGTKAKTVSNGISKFDDLSIDKSGQGYRLKAEAQGLTQAISDLFDIILGKTADFNNTGSIGAIVLDTDNDPTNGYEEFVGYGDTKSVLKLDVEGDNKYDYLVSTDGDDIPEYYWDPDNDVITEIKLNDYDGDGEVDWGIDTDGDGRYTKYFNKKLSKVLNIISIVKEQCYNISPNPYNSDKGEAVIVYDMKEDGDVTIDIYTISGEKVCVLVNGSRKAGRHQVKWNGGNGEFNAKDGETVGSNRKLARGVYIIRFKLPNKEYLKKIAILR